MEKTYQSVPTPVDGATVLKGSEKVEAADAEKGESKPTRGLRYCYALLKASR